MLGKLGIAIIALGTARGSWAQSPRVSAPISDISYEITADSSAVGRRQLGVAMSFTVAGTAPVILALPAWSPGHYTLLWFARRVSQFSVQSNGTALDWRKLDFQTWEIKPRSAGTVRVSFSYLANAVDRAVAWTAPDFAFFNGTNLFLYPVGRGFNWPARLSVSTTLPLVIRRGAETITLQLPVRLTARVQTSVLPIPGASGKASMIRHGILTGSPPPATPAR